MKYNEKEIISDLEEDNKLLSSKIEIYKEEITKLRERLEYTQKIVVLYENIMENARKENKQLSERVAELEKEIKFKN
ncbi:hypothetical protein [Brachyspira catarrhinii]|uniref:Uncharacterized protein n=1 Tax=Brachyspira catarrhinii TaxID=2528966 RepID=A0ABY2TR84_9SPIR|nr:hypothetical protein [Brachyspira catarrhinii]TKZ35344.1 hypothetical protein EZH24_05785 [Brachyspira catarrhinii]